MRWKRKAAHLFAFHDMVKTGIIGEAPFLVFLRPVRLILDHEDGIGQYLFPGIGKSFLQGPEGTAFRCRFPQCKIGTEMEVVIYLARFRKNGSIRKQPGIVRVRKEITGPVLRLLSDAYPVIG